MAGSELQPSFHSPNSWDYCCDLHTAISHVRIGSGFTHNSAILFCSAPDCLQKVEVLQRKIDQDHKGGLGQQLFNHFSGNFCLLLSIVWTILKCCFRVGFGDIRLRAFGQQHRDRVDGAAQRHKRFMQVQMQEKKK